MDVNSQTIKKEIGITSRFFTENRKRLCHARKSEGPIVIAGNSLIQKSADSSYPFKQDSNFWYLTGLKSPSLVLVIDGDDEYIICPETDPIRDLFDGSVSSDELRSISGIETIYSAKEGWSRLKKLLLKSKRIATLESPPEYIPQMHMFTSPSRAHLKSIILELRSDLILDDLREVMAELRRVKQEAEIRAIRSAINSTHSVLVELDRIFDEAINEADVLAELHKQAILKGLNFGYEPIIANGDNAMTLHYDRNNSPLDHEKLTLLDVGLGDGEYSADITRTIVRNPSARQQQVYDAVIDVYNYAYSQLKPGLDLATYEKAVFNYMGKALQKLGLIKVVSQKSVRKYFPHSTSHYLGIDVHDVGDYKTKLEAGVVLTVEPGIYIPEEGIGIRIEDNILITSDGAENLSKAIPKNIKVIS